ncbi:hypothetical protein Tsubulata_027110 [Turnera subulata]|uniref:F-box domain-containing protein n=1 Tax=Turnera subulata TaxID=218843 RepID=A0A9Q0G4P6_9ROSI|nr:hypothetical protein Tsubulata_027110 [Turnera subulata]
MELIIEILSRVAVKDLLRFKCVSKEWKLLIEDPYFVRKHLYLNPYGSFPVAKQPAFSSLQSCDGLILAQGFQRLWVFGTDGTHILWFETIMYLQLFSRQSCTWIFNGQVSHGSRAGYMLTWILPFFDLLPAAQNDVVSQRYGVVLSSTWQGWVQTHYPNGYPPGSYPNEEVQPKN